MGKSEIVSLQHMSEPGEKTIYLCSRIPASRVDILGPKVLKSVFSLLGDYST